MNHMLKLALVTLLLFPAGHTLAQTTAPQPVAPATVAPPAPAPSATQVNIEIGSFECKVALCNYALGNGIADALATLLFETGRFSLFEPDTSGTATTSTPGTSAPGADVLILGAITRYEVDAQSGGACFFGVCLGGKQSNIGADLRVVDARTRKVIAVKHVDGTSSSNGMSLNLIPGLSLNGTQSSGAQAAVSDMLRKAVDALTQQIPTSYYH